LLNLKTTADTNHPLRKTKNAPLKKKINARAAEFDFAKLHFLTLSD